MDSVKRRGGGGGGGAEAASATWMGEQVGRGKEAEGTKRWCLGLGGAGALE